MKFINSKLLVITIFLMVIFVGCDQEPINTDKDKDSPVVVTLTSVTMFKSPEKKEYESGKETLDLTKLMLKTKNSTGEINYVSFNDDNKDKFTFTDITQLGVGSHKVTITYEKFNVTFDITVYPARPGTNSWETTLPDDYSLNNDFWDNASVYFVLTDRFYNGNPANDESYGREKGVMNKDPAMYYGGDIAGLTQKLDYLDDLGVNAIWLTAPYEQIHGWVVGAGKAFKHYPYHGYYASDYTNIDANIGTLTEFETFVDAAHTKGIRVILDVVMNHPGYASIHDLKNLVPGVLKIDDISGVTLENYHNTYINNQSAEWSKWWGINWIRAGLGGGHSNGPAADDLLGSLAGLPDFKTEQRMAVDLPPFFAFKYADEINYPQTDYSLKTPVVDNKYRVRDYLIDWLSSWVREYGIDGFRCDTAKHVEKEAWYQLKVASVAALREWKNSNPSKEIVDSGDFWMVGEVFGQTVVKNDYFTSGGFNSLINFEYRQLVNTALDSVSKIETKYTDYASKINVDPTFNVLSYISSHDTGGQDNLGLFYSDYAKDKNEQKIAGSLLAFSPGAIQIYYGDEAGRRNSGDTSEDKDQKNRSQMPWKEAGYNGLDYQFDDDIYGHWSKVLTFRKNHLSIGAGTHAKIKDSPYTFSRVKGDDKVIIVLGAGGNVEVDVSSIFNNGDVLKDYYTDVTKTVADGKVTFAVDANGVLLIAK